MNRNKTLVVSQLAFSHIQRDLGHCTGRNLIEMYNMVIAATLDNAICVFLTLP